MNSSLMIFKYIILGFWNLFKSKIRVLTPEQKELYSKRLEICHLCPFLHHGICSICNCIVEAKTKVDYDLDEKGKSISGCPELKW